VSAVVSLVFISQYLYFSFFHGFMQASALKYVGQVGDQTGTIAMLVSPKLLLFFFGIFAVLIFFFLSQKEKFSETVLPKKEKAFALGAIASIAFVAYFSLLITSENGFEKLKHPIQTLHDLNSFTYSQNDAIKRGGICNYYFGDIIGMLFRETGITETEALFVENLFEQRPALASGKYFGVAEGKNLIIIQVESLETAVIEEKIGGQEITPTLNRLKNEGIYFSNYYTQVGPGNTADAEFVTLNSLYPLANTVAFIDFARNTYQALPSLLKEKGYSTSVFHGDVPNFWNRSNIYPGLGYQKSFNKADYIVHQWKFDTLADEDFFPQSVEKIKMLPKPFMATLITLTSHSPFHIPEESKELVFPTDSDLIDAQKNYLESIHYTDKAIGKFIEDLKENELYDDSLIVIYGDHGTMTGISEKMGVSGNPAPKNLRSSQVPLIVIVPHGRNFQPLKKTISSPGSHLDLYPTISALLGISAPKNTFGQDLLASKNPVATLRDPYKQTIVAILGQKLLYFGGMSADFESGTCFTAFSNTPLPVGECTQLYEEQSANLRASDLLIKGDLLSKRELENI